MFCMNCGKQLEEGARYCPACGAKLEQPAPAETASAPTQEQAVETAPVQEAVPAEATVQEPAPAEETVPAAVEETVPAAAEETVPAAVETAVPAAPMGPEIPEKKRSGAAIGVIAAVAVVVALAGMAFAGVFGGPKGKLEKAVVKTGAAYAAMYDGMGFTDLAKLAESQQVSQSISFTMGELEGDSSYAGMGLRMSTDADIPGKAIHVAIAPFYETADIATVQMGLDGTKFYLGSPELTGGKLYGLDTATLGKDITELTGDDTYDNVSFDLFDVVKSIQELQNSKETVKAVEAANAQLLKDVDVKRAGQETIQVNGASVKADKYAVTLTEEILDNYLDALEQSVDTEKLTAGMKEIVGSLGLPAEVESEFMDGFEYGTDMSGAVDQVRDMIDGMDDLTVYAYVSGGYLNAVTYEGDLDGDTIALGLYLGGGDNYVDDFSLRFAVNDDGEMILASTGDHSAKSGTFTDTTTLTLNADGGSQEFFTMETSHDRQTNAFTWAVDGMGEVQLTATGTLEIGKDGLDLQMEDLTATGYGETLMQMSAVYALGAYQAPDVDTSAVTMILTMSEDELTALEEEIFENVMALAGSLDLPDLSAGNTSDGDYDAGYDTGYQDGFSDGYDAALAGDLYGSYRESLAYHGHDESQYDGYFISGYCDGYYEGYYEGIYSADPDADPDAYHGYLMGYAFGYDDGYADGDMDKFFGNAHGTTYDASLDAYEDYDDEYLAGYQDGYPTGYDDGYTGAVYQID